jgi:hypothetical protein
MSGNFTLKAPQFRGLKFLILSSGTPPRASVHCMGCFYAPLSLRRPKMHHLPELKALHTCLGRLEKNGEERMGQVSIQAAFDSPDTLANATEYLRQYAQDTGSQAAVAVVPKHKIAYPQVPPPSTSSRNTHVSRTKHPPHPMPNSDTTWCFHHFFSKLPLKIVTSQSILPDLAHPPSSPKYWGNPQVSLCPKTATSICECWEYYQMSVSNTRALTLALKKSSRRTEALENNF